MSPIQYAVETIGVGLAAQKFGAQWFGDGAHSTSILMSDHEITEVQAKVLKERVKQATRDNREPLVLGEGATMKAIQVSPEESQFLETIKANADDIARFFFRRPPSEGGQITYANVEARSLDLLTYTLNGWMVRVEKALSRLRPRPRFVKFNADALVRVDLQTRYTAHDIAIRGGWKNVDEVRKLEDLSPLPGDKGKEYLWPPYTTGKVQTDEPGVFQPPPAQTPAPTAPNGSPVKKS
jgi:HK97 family phage portal protein